MQAVFSQNELFAGAVKQILLDIAFRRHDGVGSHPHVGVYRRILADARAPADNGAFANARVLP